jgi:uncharacterized phage protein gp47/JayE
MPFQRPTLTELVDRISTDVETRVTGGKSLLRRSVLKVLVRVFAGAIHLLYSYLEYQGNQRFIAKADENGLDELADEYGLSRSAATYAEGTATVTGSDGAEIPEDTELEADDNIVYKVVETATISGGSATITLIADEAGSDGNQDASTELTFISPLDGGVSTTATVDSDGLTGGADEETDDDFRERLLLRKQYPPHGGCEYDYKTWMLENSSVTRAWTFPEYNGVGTIGCAFVMDNSTPYIPSSETIATVREYIVEHVDPATGRTIGIPIGAEPGLFMITLTEQDMNFTVSIYPNTSTVQIDIEDALEDLIYREGGPGETIYISDIQAALSDISSLERFTLDSPSADTSADSDKIHALGTINYSTYS